MLSDGLAIVLPCKRQHRSWLLFTCSKAHQQAVMVASTSRGPPAVVVGIHACHSRSGTQPYCNMTGTSVHAASMTPLSSPSTARNI